MNRLIMYFLLILMVGFAIAAYRQEQPVIYFCAVAFFPLFMVFRNRVNDDAKQQEILDAIRGDDKP